MLKYTKDLKMATMNYFKGYDMEVIGSICI